MKHKLRSRALPVLLSFMLIIGLMPTTVFALEPVAPTTIQVNGTEILDSGNHTVSCGSGTATYDPDTNTLTLDHAEIDYQQNADLNSKGAILFDGDLNINLVGENTITSVTCGIRGTNAGTLTITGDSLTIDSTYYGIGIPLTDANITIDGADLDITAKGKGNFIGVGIQAGGVLSIKNGAYIDATDVSHHPIIGNAEIEIEDSTLYAQQYANYGAAIRSDGEVSISNSTVEAKADSEGSSAIWTGNDLSSPPTSGNITISDGSNVTLYSKTSNAVYAMLGTISISGSTVKAESFSGAYPTLCADGDIDITNHSDVTVKSADTIGIWSSGGAVMIQDSVAYVAAHDEWPAIRGDNGGATISRSWVETFGSKVSPEFTSSDSVIFLSNEGTASGSLTLPGDVIVGKDMQLSIPEGSSITVPAGVTFTNHGQIELLGDLINNGGNIVCDSHSYEDGKCTICGAIDSSFKPVITAGANGTWQRGTKDGLSFTSNAAFADFLKVQVDGKDLDTSSYTVKEGSTIVTLKAEYLETLSEGKHTLAIVSETGTATTEFTVKAESTQTPQTGDSSNVMLWLALLLVSGAGVSGAVMVIKKRRHIW